VTLKKLERRNIFYFALFHRIRSFRRHSTEGATVLGYLKLVMKRYTYCYYYCQLICN